jgi:hypothetical protein
MYPVSFWPGVAAGKDIVASPDEFFHIVKVPPLLAETPI